MRIWKRFGLVSFLLAIIVAAGGYAAWKSYPAKFKAQALLQVSAQEPKLRSETVETEVGDDFKRYQLTQVALVKSQLALTAALKDRAVSAYRIIREHRDPIVWLQDNLEVEFVGGSEVMRIALSGNDPDEVAGIVNAVKKAYMEEIVNVDIKRRADRYDKLRKLKTQYENILKERRENLRKLSEAVPTDDGLVAVEREKAELLLSHTLWSERLKLRLAQAEAETLLARRTEVVGAATDAVRKEIAQIEDRIAVVMARQKVLDRELEEMNRRSSIRPEVARTKLDLSQMKFEIAQLEEASRKVAAEVEKLNVELSAPPRVRVIEDAVSRNPRRGVTVGAL